MGLGFLEILIIAVASLVVLGPSRLPGIMRQIAKAYVQLRRTSNEFKSAFDHIVQEAENDMARDSQQLGLTDIPKKIATDLSIPSLTDQNTPSTAPLPGRVDSPFNWNLDKET